MNNDILKSDTILNSFMDTAVPEIRKAFNPSKILIFGSRVKGKATEDSDIDVIIVSDFFREIKFVKRMASAVKRIQFSRHVDFISSVMYDRPGLGVQHVGRSAISHTVSALLMP